SRVGALRTLRVPVTRRVVAIGDTLTMSRVVLPLAALYLVTVEIAVDVGGLIHVDVDVIVIPVAIADGCTRSRDAAPPCDPGRKRGAGVGSRVRGPVGRRVSGSAPAAV